MKKIFPALFVLVLAVSIRVDAARIITSESCTMNYFYINLVNVSSVAQTVDIRFKSFGGITLRTVQSAAATGRSAATCSSTTLCQNKPAFRTIPANSGLVISVEELFSPSDSDMVPNSGAYAEIEVAESTGHLKGYAFCQYIAGPIVMPMPLNGGRPF